jgi:sec-independent protein translocase protein TatA
MGLSFWHIMIVILVIVVLFGAGKIPRLAKDLGAGVNAFKSGLRNTDPDAPRPTTSEQASLTSTQDEPGKS